jgi:hypothetical protein
VAPGSAGAFAKPLSSAKTARSTSLMGGVSFSLRPLSSCVFTTHARFRVRPWSSRVRKFGTSCAKLLHCAASGFLSTARGAS